MYATAYFGYPGRESRNKVHICDEGKPVCGQKIDPRAEYQFCANRVVMEYIDCQKCRLFGMKMILAELESSLKQYPRRGPNYRRDLITRQVDEMQKRIKDLGGKNGSKRT